MFTRKNRVLAIASTIAALTLLPELSAVAAPSQTSPSVQTDASNQTALPFGASGWAFYRGTTPPPASWQTTVPAWKTGTAPFGVGRDSGPVGTTLPNDFATRPLASYFSHSFSLGQVPADGLTVSTWADDGVVVYVNGTEVGRKNLPAGPVKDGSYATAAPSSKAAKASPVKFTVPAALLHAGDNIVAAQVQSNWRTTTNLSFDASLTASTSIAAPAPTQPARPTPAPNPDPGTENADGVVPGWGAPNWRDEFTYTDANGAHTIDPAKWNVRDRSDLGLLMDAAVPDRNQVSVDAAGIAHLKADWLPTPIARPSGAAGIPTLTHKTAYLDQRSLKKGDVANAQQYGRWEIRAKVPTGPKTYGALAAFWLRNSQSGEIDIMEAWGYNEKAAPGGQRIDTATTTVHTQTSGSGNQKYYWTHADFGAPTKIWEDFHTFAFELTPTYAAIIVDGKQLTRVTPADHPNLWNPNYFASPLHMRLNLHVGPSAQYWGVPDPAHKDWTQPLDFQVDYVRTWAYQG